ncbi:MAG TPA: BTAD domain-containing putative transcriptional regulator [Actinophytocola sp.]|uniref:BTAD domain-containing putative transcriptional regulator n=1 Tax=Actinophytocola sp. TaxID=1872138 RepID=UPI002DB7673B|nr:BTAD domain-containing putative transcriptional regulator [Actinophytocola sp.]HEU5471345.1 BTAD domain-containing putative transcriptional regulator [Actinophytocola sp.]
MNIRPGTSLARPRLFDRLAAGGETRLTTVIAPAGYGKTTLLADWAAGQRTAWHTCTAEDREPRPVVDHLARAIRAAVPDLAFSVPAVAGDPHAIVAALCDALGSARLALVLDDVHVVRERDGSARVLEALCRHLPPTVRLILSSRRLAPFAVQRLRDGGALLELTAAELAFTGPEVAALLAGPLGLDGGWPARIHQATGGWPIAVRLAGEAVRHGQELSCLHRAGPLFDYLATEIFDREPARTRDLLRTASRFERFRPELLEALGHPEARAITADLVGRGLFVEEMPSARGWFGLLPLVKEFVCSRMPMRDWELRELYDVAGRWFNAYDHLDAALAVLAELGDLDRIQQLLDTRADDLLRQGGAGAVLAAVRLVPPESRTLRTWQLAGEAHQVLGDCRSALDCLQRTVRPGRPPSAGLARRIGWLHYFSGATADALEVCQRCVLDGSDPASESLLLSCVASAQWARGDLDACRSAATGAMTLAETCGDDAALAAAHTVFAMFAAAKGEAAELARHDDAGLRHAERAGDVLGVIRIRSNRASHLIEAGDYRGALTELELALPLADLTGFATYRAFCLNNRGEARLGLGQLDEAAADLVAAKNIFTGLGSCLAAVPLIPLAETYRLRGDRVLARTAYQQAIELAEVNDTATQLVPALAGMARLLAEDEPETSAELVARALSFGTGFGYGAALLASAELGVARGDGVAALHAATEAELVARKRVDDATLAQSLELQARARLLLAPADGTTLSLVDKAEGIWRELGNRRGERRLSAVRDTIRGDRTPAHPALAIQTLGGFRVLRHGEPVPVTAWQSRKARDLIKILVTRRGRPVSREKLMFLLWPGEPVERVGNRLSVALSTARTVLGSQRGASEHCVVTDGDTVRLDTAVADVDVLNFLTAAHRGLHAWRQEQPEAWTLLQAAETGYTGDFLEEDPYEDWATELREEARLTYIQVATVLAGHTSGIGEHVAASRYCLRILERDQYNEPAHLALVRALASDGSHGEARRRYRTYVARMAEIDVEPRPFPGGS